MSIIKEASQAAYNDDATQIVGKINGQWAYAHIEDSGRINGMDPEPRLRVFGDGLRAAEVMEDLSGCDRLADQDWEAGKTTWTFDDGSQIVVSGIDVEERLG